jgi:hypothetical protein
MAKPARIKDIDKGYKALMAEIHKRGIQLSVGVHEAEGSDEHSGDLTILDIATIHEFGLGNSPERSFIRGWADEKTDEHRTTLGQLGTAVLERKLTIELALERFGVLAVAQVQDRIRSGIEPELEQATIARKGSSTPLIDSGQLRSSISYEVKVKGS